MTAAVTVSTDPGARYPTEGPFSPPEAYPEYPFQSQGLDRENRVYALVRRALFEAGADAARYGTPEWNPLGPWIDKGQRVFVLTNFVRDRLPTETAADFSAKCTHASVLRPVLDYAAIATGDPRLVTFGNAPIQACDYSRVAAQTGAAALRAFYAGLGHPDVGPHDLRAVISKFRFGAIVEQRQVADASRVTIDLAADSLLDSHYTGRHPVEFRVADYAGRETMAYHAHGRHVYALNRRALDADVIISVPKLKTHSRVGVTCALKGTVGTIANKECLAHHRLGPPERGGDEYPRGTLLRDLSSFLMDRADSMGTNLPANVFRVASKVLNRSLARGRGSSAMNGSWFGNDTCWRMSLDIARLLRFARPDGSLHSAPVRKHIALVDGIVGGEGEGPLKPKAHPSGLVVFGEDAALVDATCALAMGFDPHKVPIIARSFELSTYPITNAALSDLRVTLDGERFDPRALPARLAPGYVPSKGFRDHIEMTTEPPLRRAG